MQPTASDVHVNVPMTQISIAYMQSMDGFVASRIFPNIPVDFQSNIYYTYNRGDMNRDDVQERAPGTESEGSGYRLTTAGPYFCRVYAKHDDIPDQIRGNADPVLQSLDMSASELLTNGMMIKRERIWATNFFATGKWTSERAGTAGVAVAGTSVLQWNDPASSPIEDVRAAKRVQHLASGGFAPNKLTLGPQVWDALADHPDFIERIKYGNSDGSPSQVSRGLVAQLFELDEVLVMDGIVNTAPEAAVQSNAANETNSYIGGKHALLTYSPGAPGLMTPSAGYTFSWQGAYGNGIEGNRISTFRMEHLKSDRVEIEMAFDMRLMGADLGFFFNGIVA